MIEANFLLQDVDTQLFCSKSDKNPIGYTWVKDINLASHFDGASFSDAMSMISKHEKIHVNCITIPTATVLPELVNRVKRESNWFKVCSKPDPKENQESSWYYINKSDIWHVGLSVKNNKNPIIYIPKLGVKNAKRFCYCPQFSGTPEECYKWVEENVSGFRR